MIKRIIPLMFLVSIMLCDNAFTQIADKQKHIQSITLEQAYQLALKRSEAIASKEQLIKEAEGLFYQSLSTALPKVAFKYDVQYIQHEHQNESGRFTISQPLFSGFKEFAAIAGAKAHIKQRNLEILRAKQLLFIDVSEAYYLYWLETEDHQALIQVIAALNEQVLELNKRIQLGRVRASEGAAIKSRLAKKKAEAVKVKTNGLVAKHLLEFLTGTAMIQPFLENSLAFSNTYQIEDYLNLASQRADVLASHQALIVAQKKLSAIQGDFWPHVSLDGNLYTNKTSTMSQNWDVMLRLEVPLFSGGENLGNLLEAEAQLKQAELFLNETQRKVSLEVAQSYDLWQGAMEREKAFNESFIAAQENYRLQQKDFHNSLISAYESLQSLEDLEEARRELIASQADTIRFWWKLKVKSGDMQSVDF